MRDHKESSAACAEMLQASLACWTLVSCSETRCLRGQGQNGSEPQRNKKGAHNQSKKQQHRLKPNIKG